jgi:hypothetical protein
MDGTKQVDLKGNQRERLGVALITAICGLAITGLLFIDPIKQDSGYHLFIDTRTIFGIPNFWNVVSNLPFLIVGALGAYQIIGSRELKIIDTIKMAYLSFFTGLVLIALGSAYYHLSPQNQTLLWDRLAMSIAFMALFAIVLAEFIDKGVGRILWPILTLAGIGAVLYWFITETGGRGDLRYYVLVQFLPMLIIPVILLCFRSPFTHVSAYWWLLVAYSAAKLFEHFDVGIYQLTGTVSGHTLKHIAAAIGTYLLLVSYHKRTYA